MIWFCTYIFIQYWQAREYVIILDYDILDYDHGFKI